METQPHQDRFFALHAHFYQPPRENPWTGRIDPQPSAWPFHDWNSRIARECYIPNAFARVNGHDGRPAEFVSNYEYLNFNFGPTLLAWLEGNSPGVYDAIREADRESRARFSGHGSAMAQAYNHMILPLANRRDRVTQVVWGIRDFEHHFGRGPRGCGSPRRPSTSRRSTSWPSRGSASPSSRSTRPPG